MTIENKLGIDDTLKLAHEEERLTKKRAIELYDKKILDSFEIGTFAGLKDTWLFVSGRVPLRRKATHCQYCERTFPLRSSSISRRRPA